MNNYFANNLKFLRKQKKLSRNELAKKLNVNQSTIARWENKEMGVTVENAFKLSEILETPLPQFIGTDLSLKEQINNDFLIIKEILIKKGFIERNESFDEKDYECLLDFIKANKQFIIKK